jgi:hypothetical protein
LLLFRWKTSQALCSPSQTLIQSLWHKRCSPIKRSAATGIDEKPQLDWHGSSLQDKGLLQLQEGGTNRAALFLSPTIFHQLVERVELCRIRKMRQIAGVQQETGKSANLIACRRIEEGYKAGRFTYCASERGSAEGQCQCQAVAQGRIADESRASFSDRISRRPAANRRRPHFA